MLRLRGGTASGKGFLRCRTRLALPPVGDTTATATPPWQQQGLPCNHPNGCTQTRGHSGACDPEAELSNHSRSGKPRPTMLRAAPNTANRAPLGVAGGGSGYVEEYALKWSTLVHPVALKLMDEALTSALGANYKAEPQHHYSAASQLAPFRGGIDVDTILIGACRTALRAIVADSNADDIQHTNAYGNYHLWSDAETGQLTGAIKACVSTAAGARVADGTWGRVAAMVPTKTPAQCKSRARSKGYRAMAAVGTIVPPGGPLQRLQGDGRQRHNSLGDGRRRIKDTHVSLRHTMVMCIFESMICIGGQQLQPNGTVGTAACRNREVWDPTIGAIFEFDHRGRHVFESNGYVSPHTEAWMYKESPSPEDRFFHQTANMSSDSDITPDWLAIG